MSMHSGYELEVLRTSADLVLCRGQRAGGPSVLTLLDDQQPPSPQQIERFQHEYALAAELDSAWAARPLELAWDEGRPLLVLEDFGGEPLDLVLRRVDGHTLELSRFLRTASNLAWALARVHKQGLVHKDIKPANVLVNDADDVRLFGFGIASRLVGERQTIARSELIAGTLAYMAPEQTGRMNRSVDARTDLYSLGITLYEMITGELPFSAVDPMDWIHCHIARQPPPPHSRAENLPCVIDAIILKLLAKDPEDRYQTAAGLETDLRHCLSEWERFGVVEPFLLASRDVPDQLVIPETLYGRDQQIEVLRAAFERVACRGAPEVVLVRGYAGIGKSSVVNELHKVLMPARCWFATGKFDQYKRDIPYATLGQALQGLVHQLLGKNDAELARWREAIQQALGPNGQLMVNLIPDLALLVGEQPPIPPVDSQDAVNRFYSVFRSLLEVFARPQHPLVLFIDDLQWLDEATLELLRRLITAPGSCQVLVIGAYRDNEVGPQHPLMERLGAITEAGAMVSHITLAPLQPEHVGQLLADALHTDVDSTASLAALVYEKTGGNPFFAIQFIKELAEEKLLTFDSDTRTWQWTVQSIRSKGITDNVAELMATKLNRLSANARCALGQLACLGNVGDVAVLSSLQGVCAESLQQTLCEAVEAGLLMSDRKSFAFVHDRVHEAAYALIPQADRAQVHLRIARTLLQLTTPRELEDKVFEIVNHFDRGVTAIDLDNERESVAELHLVAGKRAKASSANASALSYFAAGSALLGSDRWERLYQLSFELELNQADCEIVVGELLAAEERLTALAACVLGLSDRSAVICLTVLLYFTTGRNDQAVEVALEFLARAGIPWTARPTEAEVRAEYEEMHRKLARQPIETLIDLPAMTDAGCMAIMAVLTELFPAAYAVDRYLMELVLLRMTNLSLEYGNGESSSVAYGALNMALGEHFADYATSYGLGQVACQLVEHRGNDRYKARVYSCFGAFTLPWVKHLPLCKPMMCEAFSIGCAIGDTAFAAYNARNLITHMLVSGVPLAEVQSYAESAIEFAQAVQLGLPTSRFFGQLDLIQKLRGVSEADDLTEETWVTPDIAQQPGLAMMVCYYWIFRLQERYFAEDFPAALAARTWTVSAGPCVPRSKRPSTTSMPPSAWRQRVIKRSVPSVNNSFPP